MTDKLLDKMSWQVSEGQISDADRRYIMLRTDVLMGIFKRLPEALRSDALRAFGEAVEHSGGQSAKAYFQSLDNDAQKLLDTMAAYSAELGWGKWTFSPVEAAAFELTVKNSPFASGFGTSTSPVCHPIAGMLKTIGLLLSNTQVTVKETECAAQTGKGQCTFCVRPS